MTEFRHELKHEIGAPDSVPGRSWTTPGEAFTFPCRERMRHARLQTSAPASTAPPGWIPACVTVPVPGDPPYSR